MSGSGAYPLKSGFRPLLLDHTMNKLLTLILLVPTLVFGQLRPNVYTTNNQSAVEAIFPTYSPQMFGAVGDGTTDDTAALQSALDAGEGNTVVVPDGTYKLTSTLTIRSGTRLIASPKAHFLRSSSMDAMLINYADGVTGNYGMVSNIVVSGGIWDANNDEFSDNCTTIAFGHASNIEINGVTILDVAGGWHGIEINGSRNVKVLNCVVRANNSGNELIQLDAMTGSGNFPWFGPYDGSNPENVLISGCTIGGGDAGVGTHNDSGVPFRNVSVVNNRFHDLPGSALRPWQYINFNVSGNTFSNVFWAIRPNSSTTSARNWIIVGNDFGNGLVYFTNVPNSVFVGNILTNSVTLPDDVVASGNLNGGSMYPATFTKNGLNDGLMVYWRFSETNGTLVNDSSMSGMNGVTSGSGGRGVPGVFGYGLECSGSGDEIVQPKSLVFSFASGLEKMSGSIWVKKSSGTYGLFQKHAGGTSGEFFLAATGDDSLRFTTINASDSRVDLDGVAVGLTDGNWHHAACTYDGETMNLYYDGQLIATTSQSGRLKSTFNSLIVGGSPSLVGTIDEFRLWSRALSSNEIQAIWLEGAVVPSATEKSTVAAARNTLEWKIVDLATTSLANNASRGGDGDGPSPYFPVKWIQGAATGNGISIKAPVEVTPPLTNIVSEFHILNTNSTLIYLTNTIVYAFQIPDGTTGRQIAQQVNRGRIELPQGVTTFTVTNRFTGATGVTFMGIDFGSADVGTPIHILQWKYRAQ
jgi:hypothetical protein